MKTLLAILLSFVISEAPVLAIHGGYEQSGAASTIGSYAGVLIPTAIEYLNGGLVASGSSEVSGTLGVPLNGFGINSIGIFTFSVPGQGLGGGSIFLFSTSQSEAGGITTISDPSNNGGIIGTIVTTGSLAIGAFDDNGVVTDVNVADGQGVGTLDVIVANSANSVSPNGINVSGTAVVTFSSEDFETGVFSPYEEIQYDVDGFQQSSVATQTSGS